MTKPTTAAEHFMHTCKAQATVLGALTLTNVLRQVELEYINTKVLKDAKDDPERLERMIVEDQQILADAYNNLVMMVRNMRSFQTLQTTGAAARARPQDSTTTLIQPGPVSQVPQPANV